MYKIYCYQMSIYWMISFPIYIYMFQMNIIICCWWHNSNMSTINASYCTWEFKFSVESKITKHLYLYLYLFNIYLYISQPYISWYHKSILRYTHDIQDTSVIYRIYIDNAPCPFPYSVDLRWKFVEICQIYPR